MFKRIVKLHFRAEARDTFLTEVFEPSKAAIRAFPGCLHMELLQSEQDPNVLFTLSHWKGPEALEAYRNSELFRRTWAATKALFAEKAEAWSVTVLDQPT
jgi:quinol monooxygenase YgiN